MASDTYLTPREAATYLRTSPSTLAKRRLYGSGPAFTRIGRAVRYRREDLDAWMTASVVRSTSDRPSAKQHEADHD
jgi:excisionase family DNA binding protein